MRTFENNSCAISITSPRSLFHPRTQHGRWGHREKSRRASTRWDCRGKSCLVGLSPLSGTPSERSVHVHYFLMGAHPHNAKKTTPTRSNPRNTCMCAKYHNLALYLLKYKNNIHNTQNEHKNLLGVFLMFILIHPETHFIHIAPPLNCGGTLTVMIIPTMSNYMCFYSHNVAVVRAHTHTHTHTHSCSVSMWGPIYFLPPKWGRVCWVFYTRKLVFNPLTGDQIVHNTHNT